MCQDKKFNLDIPKIGYFLVFKHEKGWVGNQIIKVQKKKGIAEEHICFTHIGVSLGGPDMVEVAPPKTKVIDIRKKHKGRYIKIVKYKAENYSIKRYKVAIWAATLNNKIYDFFGVLRFKFKWLFRQTKGWFFCSENALYSLSKEYRNPIGKIKLSECMPGDFLNPKYFEVVWSGIIE